jgi:Zn finger protein HypA/HybF involved in hydrogenase expression
MSIPDYKICPKCKQNKHKTQYHTRKDREYIYLKSYCKECSHKQKTRKEILKQQYDSCSCGNLKSKKGNQCRSCTRIKYNNLFIKNCNHRRHIVKSRIIKDKLIPYECAVCGLKDNWNNKSITLQLDHINGINNDNRLKNLRFLCPNCHSQTITFCGGNCKK